MAAWRAGHVTPLEMAYRVMQERNRASVNNLLYGAGVHEDPVLRKGKL